MPSSLSSSLPVLLLAFIRGLLILSLAVKPSPFRWAFWLPIAGIGCHVIFYTSTGSSPMNYAVACGAATELFVASDYILLTDVQNELFLVGQQKPISEAPFRSRLRWALRLSSTPRGIGWTHEPTSVLRPHPPPTMSRIAFVMLQLRWVLFCILLFDATTLYTAENPSFVAGGKSLAAGGWLWRFLNTAIIGVQAICHISKLYLLCSVVMVTFGLSMPQAWPPLYGHWRDAYTLRKFWGRSWHQLMRRIVSSHGKFLAHRVLRLKRGTNASSYVQLSTTFLITGIMHCLGDYMLLGNWGGGSLRFFMLQAVAIACEDGVMALASTVVGLKGRWWRLLGYFWVLMWFSYSVPAFMDPLIDGGMNEFGQQYNLLQNAWQVLGKWNVVEGNGHSVWS